MKNIFKATLAVAAVAAVGMGSYKAYGSYVAVNMSDENLLLTENVLALSDGNCGHEMVTCYGTITPKKSETIVFCSDCQTYPDMTDAWYSPSKQCLKTW